MSHPVPYSTTLQVKEFLSRQISEKDDSLRKAVAARDALVSQAGIDKEVLSFLDEKSTELENTSQRIAAERDRAVSLASESQQTVCQLQIRLGVAEANSEALTLQRDGLRSELDSALHRLGDIENRYAAAIDSASAAETRTQLYEGMLLEADGSERRSRAGVSIDQEHFKLEADTLRQRVCVLEEDLKTALAQRRELDNTLLHLEMEVSSGLAERKALQVQVEALEVKLSSLLPTTSECETDPIDVRVQLEDLIADRERLELRWKTERKALALEVRKLRTELLAAQTSARVQITSGSADGVASDSM